MARRKVAFAPGEYYHIYNRGANRERIFRSDENYRFLLERIKACIQDWQVGIIAYCLMPNHYHLILRQDGERPISGFVIDRPILYQASPPDVYHPQSPDLYHP